MEVSNKKVLLSLLLVAGIGLVAYFSSKPQYLVVSASGLEYYTDTIPVDTTDLIVYQETANGLRVISNVGE